MADQTKAPTQSQDAEKAQERKRRHEPAPEHTGALAVEAISLADLLGDSAMELPVERHAALLGDPRLSQPVNSAQRARMVRQIQQTYGNAHVQRVMEQIEAQQDDPPAHAVPREGIVFREAPNTQYTVPSISRQTRAYQIARQGPGGAVKPEVKIPVPEAPGAAGAPKEGYTPSTYTPTDFRQDIELQILSTIDTHRTAVSNFKTHVGLKTDLDGLKIVFDKSLTLALGAIPVYGGAIAFTYDLFNSVYGDYKNVTGRLKAESFAQAISDRIDAAKTSARAEAKRVEKICEKRLAGYTKDDEKESLKTSMYNEAQKMKEKTPTRQAIEKRLYECWVDSHKGGFLSVPGKLEITYRSTDPMANMTFKLESAEFADVEGAGGITDRMKELMGGKIDLNKIKCRKLILWRGWHPVVVASVWLDADNNPSKPFGNGMLLWNKQLSSKLPTVDKLGKY